MRIIGSDYDGTLSHNGIDDKKKKALETWRNKGNIFALISGRAPDSLLQQYREKQFPCDYLIATSGADAIKALADYVTPGITELIEKELANSK